MVWILGLRSVILLIILRVLFRLRWLIRKVIIFGRLEGWFLKRIILKEFGDLNLFCRRVILEIWLIFSWLSKLKLKILLKIWLFEFILKLISFKECLLVRVSETTGIGDRRRIRVLFFGLIRISLIGRIIA